MGASTKRNKLRRHADRIKRNPKVQDDATRKSWHLGMKFDRQMKELGVTYDPNGTELRKEARTRRYQIKMAMNKTPERFEEKKKQIETAERKQYGYNTKSWEELAYFPEKEKAVRLKGLPNTKLRRSMEIAVNTMYKELPHQPRRHHTEYLQRLINKHGMDYKAMSRDMTNNFLQLTPCQLRNKVKYAKGGLRPWHHRKRKKTY